MHECLFLACTLNKIKVDCKEQIPWTHRAPVLSAVRLWESSSPQGCFAAEAQLSSTHWKDSFLVFTKKEPHSIPCCHHWPSWEFIPHISGTSLPFAPVKKSRWASEQRGLHFAKGGSRCHHLDHASGDGSTGGWCHLLSPAIKEWRITTFKQHAVKKQIKYWSLHILDVFKYLLK